MKKFLFVLILVVMLPFMLCSCGSQKKDSEDTTLIDRFVVVESITDNVFGYTKSIIVDTETRVMYYQYRSFSGERGFSGITVLYNADGTPMIYEGEL